MSEEKREDALEIKKISDNIYINVSTIKSDNVDLDGDSDEESENDLKSPEEKSEKDRNQGDETVGIP